MNHHVQAFNEALLIFSASDPDVCRCCPELVHHSYAITIPNPSDRPTFYLSVTDPQPIPLAWLDKSVVFAGQRRGWAVDSYLEDINRPSFKAISRNLIRLGHPAPSHWPHIEVEECDMAIARLLAYTMTVLDLDVVTPQALSR